jgi:putative hydrolase of the HAD superfamily
MTKRYKHVFFDLDKTLWDIDANSKETLTELYFNYQLSNYGVNDLEQFIGLFQKYNNYLWELYHQNKISKTALRSTRFKYTLRDFKVKNTKLTRQLSEYFYFYNPRKGILINHAKEVVTLLSKHYTLHIITNGFDDIQHLKLKYSGIYSYFASIVTSNLAKASKPDLKIFEFALQMANADKENSIMVGDNAEADCLGAKNAGIHQVFFNPKKTNHHYQFTYEIFDLKELLSIL